MQEGKRVLFIINPRSGRGQIKNRLLAVLELLSAEGCSTEVYVTQGPEDAARMAEARGGAFDLVLCSGGDGTLNETVNGLMRLPVPPVVGYIPAGSTNDFAASLKIPASPVKAAGNAIAGTPFAVDVGLFCGERYFMYVAGFGAFTEVSYLTSQNRKNILGHQAYILEGAKSLSSIRPFSMSVTADGEAVEGDFILGMVTNAVRVGGIKGLVGLPVDPADGKFEMLLIRCPKDPADVGNILTGMILKEENEMVCRISAGHVLVRAAEPVDWVLDGEYGGSRTEVEIRNLRRGIRISL